MAATADARLLRKYLRCAHAIADRLGLDTHAEAITQLLATIDDQATPRTGGIA